jgi:hypothetical protein
MGRSGPPLAARCSLIADGERSALRLIAGRAVAQACRKLPQVSRSGSGMARRHPEGSGRRYWDIAAPAPSGPAGSAGVGGLAGDAPADALDAPAPPVRRVASAPRASARAGSPCALKYLATAISTATAAPATHTRAMSGQSSAPRPAPAGLARYCAAAVAGPDQRDGGQPLQGRQALVAPRPRKDVQHGNLLDVYTMSTQCLHDVSWPASGCNRAGHPPAAG